MFKKTASLVLVAALACAVCPAGALAQSSSSPDAVKTAETSEAVKAEVVRGGNLKAEMSKLVANAKSDKALSVEAWQIQPKQSNSLSKGTKIALVVGAALVVILIIVVVHEKNHLFDDFRLGN